jgi:DNA-binding transcriptional ArsR family regulator
MVAFPSGNRPGSATRLIRARTGGVSFGPMTSHLEVQGPEGVQLVALEGDRLSIGKDTSNAVAIAWDTTVSRVHALLERVGPGWALRDMSSRNGTYVNGERIWTERPLHPRDEIRVGETRIVFRSDQLGDEGLITDTPTAPPEITRRERDVLIALCRPVFSGEVFTEPASIRDIAKELVISEAAVKQHLTRLYDKFGIHEASERRRVRLANEAIRRGTVSVAELRRGGTSGRRG